MHTFIGSTGSNCVLIILFQLYGSRAGLIEGDFFSGWVSITPPTFILEEELIQYKFNLIQFLTLIRVGFLGVRFEVGWGGGGKITPSKTC